MLEKILEQQIRKPLTEKTRDNINKRLDKLKEEVSEDWAIDFKWHGGGNALYIKSGKVLWTVTFSKREITIYIEAPFYLKPFLVPYRKKAVEILKEEIKKLMQ